MRFAIVLAVAFGLCGMVYAEDPEEKLAKEFENASKAGSPEYAQYLRRQAALEKVLRPLRAVLKTYVADESKDPSAILLYVRRVQVEWKLADASQFGITKNELDQLKLRARKIGTPIKEFISWVGDSGDHYRWYVGWRYLEGDFGGNYLVSDDEDAEFAARGLDAYSTLNDADKFETREYAVRKVSANLSYLLPHEPGEKDHPYCRVVWEGKLLLAMRKVKKWVITTEEMKLEEVAFRELQEKAKAIAERDAKDLLAELRKNQKTPYKPFVLFARHKLRLCFAFVKPEEVGTSAKAVAQLLTALEKRWVVYDNDFGCGWIYTLPEVRAALP